MFVKLVASDREVAWADDFELRCFALVYLTSRCTLETFPSSRRPRSVLRLLCQGFVWSHRARASGTDRLVKLAAKATTSGQE